jgi:hypothetical protein
MLLPPPTFAQVAGARIYRSAPQLNDQFDRRPRRLHQHAAGMAASLLGDPSM